MKTAPWLIFACFAGVAATACGRGQIKAGESLPDADPCAGKACQTPIDAVVQDCFRSRLDPISYAAPAELCRRLFVDIVGKLPSPQDFAAHCEGKAFEDILTDLMSTPEYVLARQRLWAERFGYNDARTWYHSLADLDLLVGQLYRDEIDLRQFVTLAAAHPAVLSRDESDGRVEASFQALLLRGPNADELSEFANLYRPYERVIATDPFIPDFKPSRVLVKPCACAGANRSRCQMIVLANEDVSLPLRFPQAADCQAEPGNSFFIEDATPTERASLAAPGRVLAAHPELFKVHTHEAMLRLLGYDAAVSVPEIEDGLVAGFEQDGSVRNLEAQIFRSVLYKQAQTPQTPPVGCDGKESRLFAGPRKRLAPDAYLDSIARVTGHAFGVCDHRLQVQAYRRSTASGSVDAWAPPSPVHFYPILDATSQEPDFAAREVARSLGACADRVGAQAQDESGPFFSVALDTVTRAACEDGAATAMVPSGAAETSDAALGALIDHQFNQLFLEAPSATEREAALAGIKACRADGVACPQAKVAGRLCAALLKSARFSTY